MLASVENITPKEAGEMLRHNTHNRKISEITVDQYANAMKRGAWLETGEPIIFNGESLLNGQHRLQAIVKSGIPQRMVVVRDVESESFAAMDAGKVRRLADVLSIEGEENASQLATAIHMHCAYSENGALGSNDRLRRHTSTLNELLEYNRMHPQVRKSVDFVFSFKEKPLMSRGSVACLHALFAEKDGALANEFIRKFITGVDIRGAEPLKAVRDKIILSERAHSVAGKMNPKQRATALVLGWNATREGKSLDRIQVARRGGKGRTRKVQIK